MNAGLLDQLAPAHAPKAPGLWPFAPGWWAVIFLLFAILVAITIWQRRLVVRQRRSALRELQQLDKTVIDDSCFASDLENLLRRFAVARFGHEAVARLSGDPWIEFMATRGGSALAGDAGKNFLRAAYGGGSRPDRANWLIGARGFFRRCT